MVATKSNKKKVKLTRWQRMSRTLTSLTMRQRAIAFAVIFALIGSSSYFIIRSNAYAIRSAAYCESIEVVVSTTRNSRHDCVRTAQAIIRDHPDLYRFCNPIHIDQDFGPETRAAIKCIQRTKFAGGNYSITEDGVAGPQTFRKLKRICATQEYYQPKTINGSWCGATGPYVN